MKELENIVARHLLAGYVNPAGSAQEAEFNRWYDEVHIPQVIDRIEGVIGARRYRLADAQLVESGSLPPQRYLSLYELETDDLQATADRLAGAMGDGTLDMTDALDMAVAGPVMHFYDAL